MRSNFFFIIILLLIVSCNSKQKIEDTQASKPTHTIYGEWKNAFENKRFSDFRISIKENNTVVIEQIIPNKSSEFITSKFRTFIGYYLLNESSEFTGYKLEVIDTENAVFFYTTTINKNKVSVKINVADENSLSLKCFLTDEPESPGILSPPILCFTREFVRVNNKL